MLGFIFWGKSKYTTQNLLYLDFKSWKILYKCVSRPDSRRKENSVGYDLGLE